jgi:hypothetical protein
LPSPGSKKCARWTTSTLSLRLPVRPPPLTRRSPRSLELTSHLGRHPLARAGRALWLRRNLSLTNSHGWAHGMWQMAAGSFFGEVRVQCNPDSELWG